MTAPAGLSGKLLCRFEDGLRFLATALVLQADHRNQAAALSSACDAMKCFLKILEAAAEHHLGDPSGEISHLRDQCTALLTPHQGNDEAISHAVEAARLARDQAARLLPRLLL